MKRINGNVSFTVIIIFYLNCHHIFDHTSQLCSKYRHIIQKVLVLSSILLFFSFPLLFLKVHSNLRSKPTLGPLLVEIPKLSHCWSYQKNASDSLLYFSGRQRLEGRPQMEYYFRIHVAVHVYVWVASQWTCGIAQ